MIWKLVRRHRQRLDWLGLAVAIAVFGLWPEIDLWVSGWFHESVRGWFQTDAHWTQALYRGTDGLAVAVAALHRDDPALTVAEDLGMTA